MGFKLRILLMTGLLAAWAFVLASTPPASADRGNTTTTTEPDYVPAEDDDSPPITIDVDLDDEDEEGEPDDDNEADGAGAGTGAGPNQGGGDGDPIDSVVQSGGEAQPGTNPAGDANPGSATGDPSVSPAASPDERPRGGGILSKTGSETLPLVRAGLAALTLGAGLVLLGRRRRAGIAPV